LNEGFGLINGSYFIFHDKSPPAGELYHKYKVCTGKYNYEKMRRLKRQVITVRRERYYDKKYN
jgi:hypothetical protein